MMKYNRGRIVTSLAAAIVLMLSGISAKAQLFDTTGMGSTWPVLTNSYESWLIGAFNAGRDTSDPADFGWGSYNLATHFIEGDSIYIIKTVQGNYKAISIDNLASGNYTISYGDLDGSSRTMKVLNRNGYNTKNFFYYSLDSETEKDLEPWTDNWDILFTKFLIEFPGFGSYPVTGVLHNRNVRVSQVEKPQGVAASITDTAQFPFSNNISTIGYDWKTSGPSGTTIHDSITYFVEDQYGNFNELVFAGYGGSGTGNISFTVNGQADSVSLGAGNVDQVYYSLENVGSAQKNQDKDWDIALFAQSSFSAIPIRINDVNGVELYVYPKGDIDLWNSVSLEEQPINLVSVFPNPASDLITLALSSELQNELQLEFVNVNGQVVHKVDQSITPGLQEIQVPVSGLEAGVYVLQITSGEFRASTRIVINP